LFEMSNLYGTAGDSVNAKVYLDLAIKTQKKETIINNRYAKRKEKKKT